MCIHLKHFGFSNIEKKNEKVPKLFFFYIIFNFFFSENPFFFFTSAKKQRTLGGLYNTYKIRDFRPSPDHLLAKDPPLQKSESSRRYRQRTIGRWLSCGHVNGSIITVCADGTGHATETRTAGRAHAAPLRRKIIQRRRKYATLVSPVIVFPGLWRTPITRRRSTCSPSKDRHHIIYLLYRNI